MYKILILSIFLLCTARFLHARDVRFIVLDADLDIPLEGAVLHAWDGQTYECDVDGIVTIPAPDDRAVQVQFSYPGYESIRLSVVRGQDSFTVNMRLGGGIMEREELVFEAARAGGGEETKTGRSVSIGGAELARTAQIGIIEDVMTSIKLLPGVGYAGMFNAMPSIRGGEPGDLMAVFDGFYVDNPYHLGGSVSIFDPRMVQSAKLSHGVFSARYGHTTSGLLEITSRKPDPTETELEVGFSSSAANVNISLPLGGKGGLMIMGKVTYWDPFVWLVKALVPVLKPLVEEIDAINAVNVAPYIRAGAFSGHYRFNPDLELTANGYIGGDGVGGDYQNPNSRIIGNWNNLIGFATAGIAYSPRSDMSFRATVGAGFHNAKVLVNFNNWVEQAYTNEFLHSDPPTTHIKPGSTVQPPENWNDVLAGIVGDTSKPYSYANKINFGFETESGNFQTRADFDWAIAKNFLFSAGIHEMFTSWTQSIDQTFYTNVYGYYTNTGEFFPPPSDITQAEQLPFLMDILNKPEVEYVHLIRKQMAMPWNQPDIRNTGLFSSGYTALEWTHPELGLGAEIGLRLDHFYFKGKDFSIQTYPVFNPRFNVDYNVFSGKGMFDSLDLTVGTGLFSSMNDSSITYLEAQSGISDYALKQAKTWTSIAGAKLDFFEKYSFNFEMYYKYGFDRSYNYQHYEYDPPSETIVFKFNGESHIFGFDFMLQKKTSRFFDGWISYSFNFAQYRDPDNTASGKNDGWYYPSFHRFSNLNVVLNIKPVNNFNIAARISYSSGALRNFSSGGQIISVPVLVEKDDGTTTVIQRYAKSDVDTALERDGFALPIDLKFSWFFHNPAGKTQTEIYLAIENLLAFIQTRKTNNTTFNSYTGVDEPGSTTASYSLPVPMLSFGFKWSY